MTKIDQVLTMLTEQSKQLKDHGERLAVVCDRQENFYGRMMGENGQPGIIKYLDDEMKRVEAAAKLDVKAVDVKYAGQITIVTAEQAKIKSKMTWAAGVVAGAGFTLGWIGKIALPKIAAMFHN